MRIPSDMPPRATTSTKKRGVSHKARIAIAVFLIALVVLFLSARGIAGFYTDYLWFDSLGYGNVFTGVLSAKWALAIIFALVFALLCLLNLWLADRSAPPPVPGADEAFLERYRSLVSGRTWLVRIGVSLLFGVIAGLPAASQWQSWLLFVNSQSFGLSDAQFNRDIGFYVFRLPFLTFVVDWLFAALVIVLLITGVAYYLNGGIRLGGQQRGVASHVKLHLSVLLAVLALLRAAGYWLQRYELTTSRRGFVEGAAYTDVNAQLPAIELLTIISVLAAVLLIVNVWQKGWRLPVIAVGLWMLVAIVAGTAYPAVVQRFQVEPAESSREQPFIDRNIRATRAALDLDEVEEIPFAASTTLSTADAVANEDAFADVRLLDPTVVDTNFRAQQVLRTDYRFLDLDVDRYEVGGRRQQVVLSVRELNVDNIPVRTWEGRHLAYTHGYGIAAAPASIVQADGNPDYVAPSEAAVVIDRPEVYFGEGLDGYAVVRTERDEVTFDPARQQGTTRYEGNGGVAIDSTLRRMAFALRFGEYNLFGSGLITDESRILYSRDVRERVTKLAPFLHFDTDPYPVVLDGRLVWVVDAYTTTSRYPYGQRVDTEGLPPRSGLNHTFNYVRNSVKATVDAYEGTVKLYVVDETDPIAKAWRSAFPSLFVSADAAPAGLATHFRYPEDLFRAQTTMWAKYRVTDPAEFFQGERFWNVAQQPPSDNPDSPAPTLPPTVTGTTTLTSSGSSEGRFIPYYTLLRHPGTDEAEFSMVRPFVPVSKRDERRELAGMMTVSSEPGSYGKLRSYNVTSEVLVPGPSLVASNIRAEFAEELSLQSRAGSTVLFGDLQLLPVGDALLYVRPWYVQAQVTPVPEMQYVTITLGDRTVRGVSVEEALERLFPSGNFTIETRQPGGNGSPQVEPPEGGTGSEGGDSGEPPSTTPPGSTESVEELLSQATDLYDQAQQALRDGDGPEYLRLLEEAFALVEKAAELATGQDVTATTAPADTASA